MTSKKLLVLDVNGLLVDTYFHKEPLPDESPDARVGNFYVYRRPFCEEFLQFCLDNFIVGVWSSAREYNVNNLVDYVFGGMKEKLAFIWHQSDCTDVGLKSPDNRWKPLFMKELSKLWRKVKVDLPWNEGDHGPSNTLLVDDTPYKAILNPPNTAIFPHSYTARDHGDDFLGGALRSYLEGIRDAVSVQTYVESNPFGEPSITPASPLWSYVSEVVLKVKNVLNEVGDGVAQIMAVEAVSDEGNKGDEPRRRGNREGKHHSDPLQLIEAVSDESIDEDRPKRGRNEKQKHYFDFPSEAVELQFSGSIFQPLGSSMQVHGSTSLCHQVPETANVGSQEIVDRCLDQTDGVSSHLYHQECASQSEKGISLPSGFEPSKDEHQDITKLWNSDGIGVKHHENTGVILSLEQGHDGVQEATWQAANGEQGDLEEVITEQKKENQAISVFCENKSFDLPVCDDSLNSLKPDCMQGESNNEKFLGGRQDTKNTNYVHASNNNYESTQYFTCSNRNRHKLRGTWERQNKWHNQRNDISRGSFRYGQCWKSEGGYHQDGSTKMPFFKDLDQRGHRFVNKQHIKYVDKHNSGKGYPYRNKPSFGYARHSQKRRGDRPVGALAPFSWESSYSDPRNWDQSQQDCRQFLNNETSTNAMFGNFATQPLNNISTQHFNGLTDIARRVTEYNEYGQGQDGGSSSYSWHDGFKQGAVYESSNVWPEQLNVNVHNPDSKLAMQRENDKRQWFENKHARASSQPHNYARAFRQPYRGQNGASSSQPYQNVKFSSQADKNAGGFSQPYRGQRGVSRQPYQNVEASSQSHYNNWDNYRQGLSQGGFSRSRQSQEARNL